MSEAKKKNGSWLSWALISVAFIVIVFVLLFSFMSKGKASAVASVEDRMIGYTNIWATQIKDELTESDKCGKMIDAYLVDKELDIDDDEIIYLASKLVETTCFYRIILCSDDEKCLDDRGHEYDFSNVKDIIRADGVYSRKYFFMDNDGMGSGNVMVSSYPLKDDAGCALFFLDMDKVAPRLKSSSYEDISFLVLIKKDGTIMSTVKGFKDLGSAFLGNPDGFLASVQTGTGREDYNYFKAKLYNGAGCGIESTYNGDVRTIACSPIGIEDWYVGFGIRQYEVDALVATDFKEIKATVIKLVIVLTVFALFAAGLLIFSASKSKEKGKKLEDKADTDLLTELTNKVATERMIQEYIEDNPNGHGVLFILDIDNFKKVNDTMGHAFGDTLLKTLGKEIRTEFRVTDIVGRTGGDEFMIFLKDVTDDLIVEREANRLTRFFHDFKAGGDYVKYSATASIGCATYPSDGTTFKDLYVSADQALYRAKKRGKNQLVFYNEERFSK